MGRFVSRPRVLARWGTVAASAANQLRWLTYAPITTVVPLGSLPVILELTDRLA